MTFVLFGVGLVLLIVGAEALVRGSFAVGGGDWDFAADHWADGGGVRHEFA
ncbi:MAG: hypothetical protein R2856_38240 [Caldilineaceae bacterium]